MENSVNFITVPTVLPPECCNICGKAHNLENCDFIKITKHVKNSFQKCIYSFK